MCPGLGCGYSVWHAKLVRMRSWREIHFERALAAWVLALVLVWSGIAHGALAAARSAHAEIWLCGKPEPLLTPEPCSFGIVAPRLESEIASEPLPPIDAKSLTRARPKRSKAPLPGEIDMEIVGFDHRIETFEVVAIRACFTNHGTEPFLLVSPRHFGRVASCSATISEGAVVLEQHYGFV